VAIVGLAVIVDQTWGVVALLVTADATSDANAVFIVKDLALGKNPVAISTIFALVALAAALSVRGNCAANSTLTLSRYALHWVVPLDKVLTKVLTILSLGLAPSQTACDHT